MIAQRVTVADSFLARMTGLLNRSCLDQDEALILMRCNCIHMFFMRFSIDVIFIDGKCRVVGLVKKIKPFAVSPVFWQAQMAMELAAGAIEASRTAPGDFLRISEEDFTPRHSPPHPQHRSTDGSSGRFSLP